MVGENTPETGKDQNQLGLEEVLALAEKAEDWSGSRAEGKYESGYRNYPRHVYILKGKIGEYTLTINAEHIVGYYLANELKINLKKNGNNLYHYGEGWRGSGILKLARSKYAGILKKRKAEKWERVRGARFSMGLTFNPKYTRLPTLHEILNFSEKIDGWENGSEGFGFDGRKDFVSKEKDGFYHDVTVRGHHNGNNFWIKNPRDNLQIEIVSSDFKTHTYEKKKLYHQKVTLKDVKGILFEYENEIKKDNREKDLLVEKVAGKLWHKIDTQGKKAEADKKRLEELERKQILDKEQKDHDDTLREIRYLIKGGNN